MCVTGTAFWIFKNYNNYHQFHICATTMPRHFWSDPVSIPRPSIFQIEPVSWDLQASFLIECHNMFQREADETAHPLHIDLRNTSVLLSVFDFTSYVKGNCMAHMIYHFLGERIFLSSMRRYMRTYYYRSADQEDLWSAFQVEIDEAYAGLPTSSRLRMKDVMRTWTYQAGFPVLRVRQNRETGAIELTQVRPDAYHIDRFSTVFFHLATSYNELFSRGMRTLIIVTYSWYVWEKYTTHTHTHTYSSV